jgi:hypothetical protein
MPSAAGGRLTLRLGLAPRLVGGLLLGVGMLDREIGPEPEATKRIVQNAFGIVPAEAAPEDEPADDPPQFPAGFSSAISQS